jgi:hypothetical protein
MANVPLHFSATIEDGLQRRKSTDAYLNLVDTTTLATLAAAYGTFMTDLDGVTAGAIVEGQIRIRPALPGGLATATGATWLASRVAQTGIFRFSASGTTAQWSSAVPALADAMIVNDAIDPTGSGTYTGLLTGGSYVNPENQVLLALTKTLIRFRKANK